MKHKMVTICRTTADDLDNPICYLCGLSIPRGMASYYPRLRVMVCLGWCNDMVIANSRDFSKSKAGRKLPAAEVMRKLALVREVQQIMAPNDACIRALELARQAFTTEPTKVH